MCTPFTDTVCGTPYSKKACNTVTEEKCEVVYDTQLEEECRDTQQTLCRDIVRQECGVVEEDKCETRYESVESEECREEEQQECRVVTEPHCEDLTSQECRDELVTRTENQCVTKQEQQVGGNSKIPFQFRALTTSLKLRIFPRLVMLYKRPCY